MKGRETMRNELDKMWDYLIDHDIATEQELQLVTSINGYNADTLNDVLYVRTGYRSIEQLEDDVLEEYM